jgi:hypothetical protein
MKQQTKQLHGFLILRNWTVTQSTRLIDSFLRWILMRAEADHYRGVHTLP